MDKDNRNTELDNTDKKLHISDVSDSLFKKLKSEMIEYCSDNDDITLEQQIQYHIDEYKRYNHRRKNGYVR